jgi:hypothetical protein
MNRMVMNKEQLADYPEYYLVPFNEHNDEDLRNKTHKLERI